MKFETYRKCCLMLPLLFFIVSFVKGQTLIPNGGFESYDEKPVKWNTSGSDFTRILTHWSSPTQASPDVYGPDVEIPGFWKKKGFGFISPIEGQSFVGATLFGCIDGKPHCREYVQIKMSEPLVPGQQYELSFMLSPLSKGLRINNIGDSIGSMFDEKIEMEPATNIRKIVSASPGKWVQAKLLFQAKAREQYLIIGNFYDDDETRSKKEPIYTQLKFAYYYFDDVRLKKIPPIIEYVDTTNVFLERSYEIDERVILENVYFDYDESTLLPKSYLTLSHLLELLRQYPSLVIQLVGHTDADGGSAYNKRLSRRRARTVFEYLVDQGVDTKRVSYHGEGEEQPISTNDTEEGRSLNRRVEFRVLSQ